jgi:hypothetical protein
MKHTEIMKEFGISRTTVQNWKTSGCPIGGDVAAVAEWKAARDLAQQDADPEVVKALPPLVGELTRRWADLDRRIELVNQWSPGTKAKPNLLKAATVGSLILEGAFLRLPVQLLAAGPSSMPECFFSVVFDALDRARGEDDDVQDKTRRARRGSK